MICKRCDGRGGVYMKCKNLGTLDWEEHYVCCPQPGCKNGHIDTTVYYDSWHMPGTGANESKL